MSDFNLDDDYEETTEIADDDIFISPTGPLGSHYSVSTQGKCLGVFKTTEGVDACIKAYMERNSFYPNVWGVSDHGNISPYNITGEQP